MKTLVFICITLVISLVNSKTENLDLNNEYYRLVRAEGDPVTEDPGSGGGGSGTVSNSSSHLSCRPFCCAQYTWPGNGFNDQITNPEAVADVPRTCDKLPGIANNRANSVACFNPLIYSNGTRRPDPDLATKKCETDSIHCFCSGRTCLKYSYLRNDDAKTVLNETRFCGTLTNVGSNTEITSGCYRETVSGTSEVREVCACTPTIDGYCNTASNIFFSKNLTFLFFTTLFFLYFYAQ